MQYVDARRRREAAEERASLMKAGDMLTRLVASEEYVWIDTYFANRQNMLINELTTPAAGGDGMSIALRAENNKGALQEIRLFIATIKNIMGEYQQVRKTAEVPGEEVPKTAAPPKSEGEMPLPEAKQVPSPVKENSDADA